MYHTFYFLHRSQEHQDMSVRFLTINIHDRLEYFEEIVASGLPEVVHEHLVQAARDVDRLSSERPLLFLVVSLSCEKTRDGFSISSRRGHNHLEISSQSQYPLQKAKQNVVIYRPFVNIVEYDHRVLLEKRTGIQLLDQ